MTEQRSSVAARAPGKLILGGEHAVVAGRPALLVAVDRRLTVRAGRTADGLLTCRSSALPPASQLPLDALDRCRRECEQRHTAFLEGHLAMDEVLAHPHQLVQYAVARALEAADASDVAGLEVELDDGLPPGSGMGSSAAAVLGTLAAVGALMDGVSDRAALYELALAAERLCHGRPSGADPYVVLHGGLVRFVPGLDPVRLSGRLPVCWAVQTGRPLSGTGECVAAVQQRFPASAPDWVHFEQAAADMEQALLTSNSAGWMESLRRYHRLLQHIGVVSERVMCFIKDVEQGGGAAKICGAGTVRGEAAGTVLASGDPDFITSLCRTWGFPAQPVRMDTYGTQGI